ncbi:hypothetical protein [Fodinicola acaciae]|uniref:hypothetical protein n=1 Tax=Fodinicola acaciae TaxID=2681555 RepID=UPI0013D84368|nr:hypothetical protein [Fodinicola acaciae]
MSDLDFSGLDDPEPPVATDSRLEAAVTRGRQLRRRRGALTAGATMAAVVLVVALAGVVGLVRTHLGPTGGVPAAGGTTNSTAIAPPTATPLPDPSAPTATRDVKLSEVLSTDGVGPYMIGTPTKLLQADGTLPLRPVSAACPNVYAPTGKLDPATLRIVAEPPGFVGLVEAKGLEYVTPSGAYVGMPEARLAEVYGAQLLPVAKVGASYAYTVGTVHVVGFVVTDGQVSNLLAGTKQSVVEKLKSGTVFDC